MTPEVAVTNPAGFTRTLFGSATLTGLTLGDFVVTATPVTVAGIEYAATVAGSPATVTAGGTARVMVEYVAQVGAIQVDITGVPGGAAPQVRVTGPNGYDETLSATMTLAGLPRGVYEVVAPIFAAGGEAYRATVTPSPAVVTTGGSVSVKVAYAPFVPPTPDYEPGDRYAVGDTPNSVVATDLNGDGSPDLVVGHLNEDTLRVLLNDGNGSFGVGTIHDIDSTSFDLQAADLDGDENADVVVGTADGRVLVLFGDGRGNLSAPQPYSVGGLVREVVISDLDGDGSLDVAAVTFDPENVVVLLNKGDGKLESATAYLVGDRPRALDVGDVDGDGDPDLVIAHNVGATVSFLLNAGDGTFTLATTELEVDGDPTDVVVEDFDSDGVPDVAAISNMTGLVSVFLNEGEMNFSGRVSYGAGSYTYQLEAFDVGGDGVTDLVLSSQDSQFSVLIGRGNGAFLSREEFATGPDAWGLATADVDGDGEPDVIVTSRDDHEVRVHMSLVTSVVD